MEKVSQFEEKITGFVNENWSYLASDKRRAFQNFQNRWNLILATTSISNVKYLEAQKSDRQEIKDFLMSGFLHDEPNSRAQKMTEKDFEPICNVILDRSLESPFSTIVKDKGKNSDLSFKIWPIWKENTLMDLIYSSF